MTVRELIRPTKNEVFFDRNDIIVSKTDVKGRITYANRTFCAIASYSMAELMGAPHSIIRHPDMPRAVFKLLWDTALAGDEVFAYVKNMARTGDYYWVFAHVTPSFDASRAIVGFHSNRRVPDPAVIKGAIEPLYAELKRIEDSHANAKQGLQASSVRLQEIIKSKASSYDEFIFS